MTTFTDGKNTITIRMQQLDPECECLSYDISDELLDTGVLETDESGAYIWFDLPGIIALALDWKYSTGDFCNDHPTDPGLRCVWVNDEYIVRHNHTESAENPVNSITHQPINKYENECSAILSSTRLIRQLCDTIDHTFRHISDKADPKLVSEIIAEVRRAETALSFANNAKWRCTK